MKYNDFKKGLKEEYKASFKEEKKPVRKPWRLPVLATLGGLATVAACSAIVIIATSPRNSGVKISKDSVLLASYETPVAAEYSDEYEAYLDKLSTFLSSYSEAAIEETYSVEKNSAVSPLSAYMALSLMAGVSKGTAREEILNAFGITEDEFALTKDLFSRNNWENDEAVESIVNSIWLDKSLEYKEDGVKKVAASLCADIYHTPFHTNNKQANQDVQNYVKDKTNGLINKDLEISSDALFVLMNALYIKDIWGLVPFDTCYNVDFTQGNGETVTMDMLRSKFYSGKALETEDYSAFRIDSRNRYRVYFMKPKTMSAKEIMTTKNIYDTIHNAYYTYDETVSYETRVIFPSFTAEDDYELDFIKEKYGIQTIYNNPDFSSILYINDAAIYRVRQLTKLEVNAKGFSGAAITYAEAANTAAPWDEVIKEELVMDKAFGYVITDRDNNILFSGIVNK